MTSAEWTLLALGALCICGAVACWLRKQRKPRIIHPPSWVPVLRLYHLQEEMSRLRERHADALLAGARQAEQERQPLLAQIGQLNEEIETDNQLLAERDQLLDVLLCGLHGRCVPHAIERVEQMQEEIAQLRGDLELSSERYARLDADAAENCRAKYHINERQREEIACLTDQLAEANAKLAQRARKPSRLPTKLRSVKSKRK